MSHLAKMATVLVPVTDQDRALEFFTGTLGFAKDIDFQPPAGARWLEVEPPGGGTRLSLVPSEHAGVETGVVFDSADLEADHAALDAHGLAGRIVREGDEPIAWAGATLAGVPAMFVFRDPDGNSYLLVQQG